MWRWKRAGEGHIGFPVRLGCFKQMEHYGLYIALSVSVCVCACLCVRKNRGECQNIKSMCCKWMGTYVCETKYSLHAANEFEADGRSLQ